jgi:dUTP pyrophosphatase
MTNLLDIKIKIHENGVQPLIVDKSDWIDLCSSEEVYFKKDEHKIISLGISMEIPLGYEAHLLPRSSTYKKWGIIMVNSMGIIDNSYRGDNDIWGFSAVAMRNTLIKIGDRICQFRIMEKQPLLHFDVVDTLGNIDRGGYGSTG